jgi:hypothetical protein
MNNTLLVGDLHLDDNPLNAYRWEIFPTLSALCRLHKVGTLIFLGDAFDRKDRHAAPFVNDVVGFITDLQRSLNLEIFILMGNHDASDPVPYWSFLNELGDYIHYVVETNYINDPLIYLLPWSSNPLEDWKGIKFSNAKAILMHQTVSGALVENDRRLDDANPMPILPRGVPVFSGDVHRPQRVGGITYVGAPYPVRFSENWANRIILIENSDWKKSIDIPINIIRRAILDLTEVPKNFKAYSLGDQIRIRYHLAAEELQKWPELELQIRERAKTEQIVLASVEPVLERELPFDGPARAQLDFLKPEDVLGAFAKREELSADVVNLGIEIFREARK